MIFYQKHIDIADPLDDDIRPVQATDNTGTSDEDVPAAAAVAALFGL